MEYYSGSFIVKYTPAQMLRKWGENVCVFNFLNFILWNFPMGPTSRIRPFHSVSRGIGGWFFALKNPIQGG